MKDVTKKKIVKWFWIFFTVPVVLVIALIGMVWAVADIPSFEDLENMSRTSEWMGLWLPEVGTRLCR